MQKILLTLIFTFGFTNIALADPASVAFAVGSFFVTGVGGIAASAAVLTAVGNAIIIAAAVAVNASGILAPGVPAVNPGVQKSPTEIREGGILYAWGRVKVAGRFAWKNSSGFNIHRVLMQCQGEIDAYEQFFIGNNEVLVDLEGDGRVLSFPWSRPNGETYAFIKVKNGDGTETAYPELIEDFPDEWTVHHRIRGIAQMYVRLVSPGVTSSLYQRLFGDQTVRTDYSTVMRARLVYDPRLAPAGQENTAWTDRQYYRWSENGILNVIDLILLQEEYNYTDIDWVDVAAEADKADALVQTKTGTEPRARFWGIIETEQESRANIIKSALESIDAYHYENYETGLYSVRLDVDNPESEVTFDDRDIINYEFSPKEAPIRNNIVSLSYYSKEYDYDLGEISLVSTNGNPLPWSIYPDEIARNGESAFDIGLPFCPSHSQAQRIARKMFMFDRARTGRVIMNFGGMLAYGRRYVTFDFGDGIVMKVRVDKVSINDEQAQVEVQFTEVKTLSPWNPAVDEADPPEQLEPLTASGDLDTPAAPSSAAIVRYPNGTRELRVIYNANVGDATLAEAIYRTFNNQGLPTQYFEMEEVNLVFAYTTVTQNLAGVDAEFRVRAYDDNADNISSFSDPLMVTLQENNAKPPAPVVTGAFNTSNDTYSFSVSIPPVLSIVSIRIDETDMNGVVTTQNARNGDVFNVSGNIPTALGTYSITWQYITSNGTLSDVTTRTINITN